MSFKKNKYKVIKNCVSKDVLQLIAGYTLLKRSVHKTFTNTKYITPLCEDWGTCDDPQVPNVYVSYGDILADTILQIIKPKIEKENKEKIFPTYSYYRIYEKGSILDKHTDRPECNISGTLFVGGDSWPIFLEKNKKKIKIKLQPGDLLIYKGEELPHWREKFEGNTCIQIFFHYVTDKNLIWDSRPHPGLPAWFSEKNKKFNYTDG
jgi:hypothetical protein